MVQEKKIEMIEFLSKINDIYINCVIIISQIIYILWGLFYCPVGIYKILFKWKYHKK